MRSICVLIAALICACNAPANLILNIDTQTEEVFITGSDEILVEYGTEYPYGEARFEWLSSDYSYSEGPDDVVYLNQGSYLTNEGEPEPLGTAIAVESTGGIRLLYTHRIDSPYSGDGFLLTGTGVRSTYMYLSPEAKDALENYSSGDLYPLDQLYGTPTAMSVQVIPEPSSALLMIVGTGGLAFYRRSGNHSNRLRCKIR